MSKRIKKKSFYNLRQIFKPIYSNFLQSARARLSSAANTLQ